MLQRGAHVGDALAGLVPAVAHLFGRRAVFEFDDDQRLAWPGVAADGVGLRHFLQRALDLVGHLLGDLLRGGPGPEGLHHHRPEGEWRVYVLAQLKVGRHAQRHQHHQEVAGERGVLQAQREMLNFALPGAAARSWWWSLTGIGPGGCQRVAGAEAATAAAALAPGGR